MGIHSQCCRVASAATVSSLQALLLPFAPPAIQGPLHDAALAAAREGETEVESQPLATFNADSGVVLTKRAPFPPIDMSSPTSAPTEPGAWQEVQDHLLETARINPKGTTLVLDLDETLLHARHLNYASELPEDSCVFVRQTLHRDDMFDVAAQSECATFCMRVQMRPYLREFLTAAFEAFDNVVVYTAGTERYARGVCAFLLSLVPGRRFSEILDRRYTLPHIDTTTGRRSAIPVRVKDLERLGVDLKRTVMLDDHWEAIVQVENVLPVGRFVGDEQDTQLKSVAETLTQLANAVQNGADARDVIAAVDRRVFKSHLAIIENEMRRTKKDLGGSVKKRLPHWQKEAKLSVLYSTARSAVAQHQELHPHGEVGGDSHTEVILKKIAIEMTQDVAHKSAHRLGESAGDLRKWPRTVTSHLLARCNRAKEISALLAIQRSREAAKRANASTYSQHQLEHAANVYWKGKNLSASHVAGAPRVDFVEDGQSTQTFLPQTRSGHDVPCTAGSFAEPPTVVFRWDELHTAHVGGDEHWATITPPAHAAAAC